MNNKQVTLVVQPKSMAATILLSVFFGPLGMLYSTILGGIIMLVVSGVVAVITLGFGLLVTQPICIIWAAIATSSHNKKMLGQQDK